MQFNHYAHDGRHVQPSALPSHTAHDLPVGYTDSSHHQTAMAYGTANAQMPAGNIGNHSSNISQSFPFSPYATQSSSSVPDDQRSYFAATSSGNAYEQYATPHSPYMSAPSGHMNAQSPRHVPHSAHHSQQFAPTPSQAYYSLSTSSPRSPARSSVEPYYHMSPNPQHVMHHSPTHGGRTTHGSHSVNPSTGSGERYPCDLCDRSFTRLHDRRRHYETVHAPSPVLHKCRYCRKDFSRADSLKRHLDNGCDDKPR
ncbi:hypothetical protein BU15DRAFT_77067 [Melanogaster broomeanus]|nr:hypothetical protein BU15DRAFT_77067 [Melanogaster broomeanus]